MPARELVHVVPDVEVVDDALAARVVPPDSKRPAEKSGISIANVRIAATIWFFVSADAKTPIARKYAPMQRDAEVARAPPRRGRRRSATRRNRTKTRLGIQSDEEEAEGAEELPEDDRRLRDRRGQQHLERARLALLGEQPHRDDRDDEEREDPEVGVREHQRQEAAPAGLPAWTGTRRCAEKMKPFRNMYAARIT